MKKNWKLIAHVIAATVVLLVTACAADEKPEPPSLTKVEVQTTEPAPSFPTDVETQETETSSDSPVGEKTQETETLSGFPVEEKTQEIEPTSVSSIEEEIDEYFLEDYYNTPDGKAAIEADFTDLAKEGMSVTISVILDSIDVVVKYEDSTLLTEDIEETLAQQLESMTDRFWRWTIAYDEVITYRCVLTVRYIDPDGNILAEQSYSAE